MATLAMMLRKIAAKLKGSIRRRDEDTSVWFDDVWLVDSAPVESPTPGGIHPLRQ